MQSISFYFKNPQTVGNILLYYFCRWMPDKMYLKLKYRLWMGEKLNLTNPHTFSEKLQWLKLYNRKPEYTIMVDKVKVKDYVASVIGDKYIIPTLGVWDDPEKIDFDSLPQRFVLKCNHNSGLGMYICKDKSTMDVVKVKRDLKKGLKQNFYIGNREWPYKDVPRRILAEQFIEHDPNVRDLPDYKFFCFNGKVKALFVATDRHTIGEEVKFDFFDAEYNHLPFLQGHDNAIIPPPKPSSFEEMKDLASRLSRGIPHVRIDFYEHNNRPLFGEMTFFHFGGNTPFRPNDWDLIFGEWLDLPQKK